MAKDQGPDWIQNTGHVPRGARLWRRVFSPVWTDGCGAAEMGGVSCCCSHRAGLRRRGYRSQVRGHACRWRCSREAGGRAIIKGGGVHPWRGRGQAAASIREHVVAVEHGCCSS